MKIVDKIDNLIECLACNEKGELYKRWATEYKQRYYRNQKIAAGNKPNAHSRYPGFESNLNSLFWNLLQENHLDPHGEWPYASQIAGSTERVDIHMKCGSKEQWFELGMYATDEKRKYQKDFEKLSAIVRTTKANNVGCLIHFEVFERGKVSAIFKQYAAIQYPDIRVVYREFKLEGRLIICRLVLTKKTGGGGTSKKDFGLQ